MKVSVSSNKKGTYVDADLDHLSEMIICLVSPCNVTVTYSLEGSRYALPTLKEWSDVPRPSGRSVYINYLNFLCTGDLSLLLSTPIHLFNYLYRHELLYFGL